VRITDSANKKRARQTTLPGGNAGRWVRDETILSQGRVRRQGIETSQTWDCGCVTHYQTAGHIREAILWLRDRENPIGGIPDIHASTNPGAGVPVEVALCVHHHVATERKGDSFTIRQAS
jgi:hypothetical protein